MIGFDIHYQYPAQVEVIDGTTSYVSGYASKATAVRDAKRRIASRHASTYLQGRDCTVIVHTEYASILLHRRRGHTDRHIALAG